LSNFALAPLMPNTVRGALEFYKHNTKYNESHQHAEGL